MTKYLLSEDQTTDDIVRHSRKRLLLAKGYGGGTPVSGPVSVSGPTTVPSPSVVKKTLSTVAGPEKMNADEWAEKFGGAAKKAAQTAVENK